MAIVDRSKFKATNIVAMKSENQRINDLVGQDKGRAEYLEIENGLNRFRIYPAHPYSKFFIYASCVSWLPIIRDTKDEKTGSMSKKEGKQPIFNSKIHFSPESTDVVEAYINFVMTTTKASMSPEKAKEKLNPFFGKDSKIFPKKDWVCYAHKITIITNGGKNSLKKEFGRLKLSDFQATCLNSLSVGYDKLGLPIETDPFTDIETGKALVINRDKDVDPSKMYTLTVEFQGDYTLTDEELDNFLEAETLESMFVNSYKKSDFEKAIVGLQLYDKKFGFNAFQNPEWVQIAKDIAAQYPDEVEKETTNKEVVKTKVTAPVQSTKTVNKQVAVSDKYELMTRDELKLFIKKNEIPFTVLTKHKETDLRDAIRSEMTYREEQAKSLSEIDEVEEDVEEVDEVEEDVEEEEEESDMPWDNVPEVKKPEPVKVIAPLSAKEKMAAMQLKLKGNK